MTVVLPKMSTYITGHCAHGNHEGTKKLSVGGALFPACAGIYAFRFKVIECSCWCHEMFREARAAKAQDVTALSDPIPTMQLGNGAGSVPMGTVTQANGGASEPITAPTDADFWTKVLDHQDLTIQVFKFVSWHVFKVKGDRQISKPIPENSRRPRGSLDINVEAICRLGLEGLIPNELTPSNIGLLIDPLNPPSAGAIHAVLTRWKEAGYCTLSDRPVTMTGFTDRVNKSGITGAKKISAREREARAKGFF